MARYWRENQCLYFELSWVRAKAAMYGLFVLLFALVALSWIISQRKISSPFKTVRWYNYGLTLLLWNLYVIASLISFCLDVCYITSTVEDSWRVILVNQILMWFAMALLLGTVLLPVCSGLERLHGTHSKGWQTGATVLLSLFTALTIVFLGLLIWQATSVMSAESRYRSLIGAFPQYIDVYAALATFWFVIALAAIAKMLLTVNRAHIRATRSLKIWVFILAFGLFGIGFLYTFNVFYYNIAPRGYQESLRIAASIAWQVLFLLFSLLPVFAIREVSRILGAVLASTNVGGNKFGRGFGLDPESSPSAHQVVVR